METKTTDKRIPKNLLLMGAAVVFVALAVVLCVLLRANTNVQNAFRIRFGDGTTVVYPADEPVRIVIRDGMLCNEATGEGEENVIRIENGSAWMESATCPHQECIEQGRLNAQTVQSRPLGVWIICAPHNVSIEYLGDGA